MVQVDLSYDRLGSRLVGIGTVPLTYDRLGSRARALGHLPLEYDQLGNRLRAIGPYRLEYGWSNWPRRLGAWQLHYKRWSAYLKAIGPYPLTYRGWWSGRVETVGPIRIHYDRLGSRPARAELPAELPQLTEPLLIALFYVLYHAEQVEHWQQQRTQRS